MIYNIIEKYINIYKYLKYNNYLKSNLDCVYYKKFILDPFNPFKYNNCIIKYSNRFIWLIENTDITIECNKNIFMNLIKKYKEKWNYRILSYNPNLTEEFILKYPYKDWDIKYLIENNKITDFKALSKFNNINQYIIDKYPNKPWDWEWIIENINIKKHKNKQNYRDLSYNPNITEEYILKYPYQNWDIRYLIKNNKITDFKALSKFKNITHCIIYKYLNKPWDWEWIFINTSIYIEEYIPLDIIEKYSYKWDYSELSYNPNLTEEFILKYPYKNWDIGYLIKNNKITNFKALTKFININQYIIDKYPNKPWDWERIIENTNIDVKNYISPNIIKKYLYKWDYKN